ncbi:hypothetical protein M2163_005313 [Streptomyces sp. SAI-135]|jgi:hypothetical protein|uniref:hypothetical protein n=1 Tax=unclassified Streptomyces TaxID=2593676 RepID=UPI00247415D1|nr:MULTISPECIES: hypothetical protein [unclassified Streptomyces]MDH6517705.1 hypothetical protein [Streptomyces sp. SAI-090]MDH6618205.1 hypothetical protein [Streptomyces sp. SAI-135]
MSSVSVGRVVAGALVLAGLGSGVAVADDAPGDGLEIQAPYEQAVVLAPGDGGAAQYRSMALGLQHYNSDYTVTDGRLTVDASGLAGVAEIAWPDNCAPDAAGTVAVCDTGDVPVRYSPQVQLRLRAAAGAAVGAQGAIEYSATATGGPAGTLTAEKYSAETFVTVGSGPDLGVSAPQDVSQVTPGTDLTVPFSVTNTGNETAHGFTVQMWATYGLDVTTRYPQCTYTGPDDADAPYPSMTYVTCSFGTDVAPGASVELPEPLRLAVTGHALHERFDYDVAPGGAATDLDSSDNGRSWHIDAVNTADFAVHGTDPSGAQGETVAAGFRFVNRGPAWVADVASGDPVPAIDYYLPPGTTATSVPDTCRTVSSSAGDPAVPHYVCTLPTWTRPDLKVAFPFRLRVDQVIPDAEGRVVVRPYDGSAAFAFDPDTRNNTAEVVVNPSA